MFTLSTGLSEIEQNSVKSVNNRKLPNNSFYSGCNLFKPFEPIVFLELLIHSLTNAHSVD